MVERALPQVNALAGETVRGVSDLARLRLVTGLTLILNGLVGLLGADWDIQWHSVIGHDRTFTPPHNMILISIGTSGIVALISILIETHWSRRHPELRAPGTDFGGVLRSSLGSYLVGFGAVCAAVAFPLDTYWHALYGIDVSLWAPFHTMLYMGGVLATFGVIYILLSAAHLSQMQHERWTVLFSYAGLVAELGILLSKLNTFLFPALIGYNLHLASLTLNFFSALLALVAVFVCVLAVRLVPWTGAASMVVVAFLLLFLLVSAFVPPMMTRLVQAEHQTYLAQASSIGSTIVALLGQTPVLLLASLSLDGVVWLGRLGQWAVVKRNTWGFVTVMVSMILVTGLILVEFHLAGGGSFTRTFELNFSRFRFSWRFLAVCWETGWPRRSVSPSKHCGGKIMYKAIQLVLCLCAVVSLVVTGIAFYQIVLASTIHGSPVRFIEAQAGSYPLKLALYSDSIQAGDVIPFDIAVAPGTRGPLTYQVMASPGPGVPAELSQGDVNAQQSTSYGVPGSITLVTRGPWTLHIVITGPAGRGEAALPLTAVTFPAMPAWLAWNIGLLPVYGLLLFWITQNQRAAKQRPGGEHAKPGVPTEMA